MSLKCHDKNSPFPPLQDTVLRVYSNRICPYAQRTLLVLEHKNIPYEVVNINLKNKPEWFLERNPLGTVPTMEKGGQIIYESTAACEWIDDMYPCPRLVPSDPFIKAQDRMLLEYFGKLTSVFLTFWLNKEGRNNVDEELRKHYKHYEEALSQRQGPLFGGAVPSLLDFYLWPHFERIAALSHNGHFAGVSETDCPALTKWYTQMYELPAVKKCIFSPEIHEIYFRSSREGKNKYDLGL